MTTRKPVAIEPNMLSHRDLVRRHMTTPAGNLKPGVSYAEYRAALVHAGELDTAAGPNPSLALAVSALALPTRHLAAVA